MIKDHYFKSYDGVTMYVKEKYMPLENRSAKVFVCHPSGGCSHHFFDCPISDYSLMDHLANEGFRVFAYDPRGFGSSYHPPDGRSVTYEVLLKDTEAFVNFVLSETKAKSVSMMGFGLGAQVVCGHALRHPDQVDALVLMEFSYKVLASLPLELKEMLLGQRNGYFEMSILSGFLAPLLRFVSPEIQAWFNSTFTVAPVIPFFTAHESPLPLIKPVEKIKASVFVIYGTQAGITTPADCFDFLSSISSQVRVIDVIEGAGATPSIEKDHYLKVLKDISWFLSR